MNFGEIPIKESPRRIKEAMLSIGRANNPKTVIMEVIGAKGKKVAEYVDKGDDTLPYQELNERISNQESG